MKCKECDNEALEEDFISDGTLCMEHLVEDMRKVNIPHIVRL